jgi:3-isopropylmalate/(R)-2-methylmalate dehydratase small subunit
MMMRHQRCCAGTRVVVAESYARIFFRNCVSTGELYPCDTPVRIVDKFTTGEEVEVDMEENKIRKIATGEEFDIKPLGDAAPVIDAGGIFEYARRTGMIKSAAETTAAAAAAAQ